MPSSFADIAVGPGASIAGSRSPEPEGEEAISLNDASFEQLRDAGLSVTQTGRVLAHRERQGGFSSVDELDEIPGFSQDFLGQIKSRLRV
jgi:competence protein ComEA